MFYLCLQFSSASRQPKISNLAFLAKRVLRVRSHPSACHLGTFQWHCCTRSSNNSIFLFEIYQFSFGKYSTFIYNPQALLESEKIRMLSVSTRTQYEERSRRDTWKFSPDTTGHGLRITKRPAVWHFSIFLFEKYQFLLENILSLFRILRVRRNPNVTL